MTEGLSAVVARAGGARSAVAAAVAPASRRKRRRPLNVVGFCLALLIGISQRSPCVGSGREGTLYRHPSRPLSVRMPSCGSGLASATPFLPRAPHVSGSRSARRGEMAPRKSVHAFGAAFLELSDGKTPGRNLGERPAASRCVEGRATLRAAEPPLATPATAGG